MNITFIKKLSLFLCLALTASTVSPAGINGETKKASAASSTITDNVGNYTFCTYSTPKAGAKYSCIVSNKKVAKAYDIRSGYSYESGKAKLSLYATVYGVKKGSSKVKIKETYKNKTKAVKIYKVKFKAKSSLYSNQLSINSAYFNTTTTANSTNPEYSINIEKGDSVSLNYLFYCVNTPSATSSNTKVATVSKKGILTTKSVGTSTITVKNKSNTYKFKLNVVARSNSSLMKKTRAACNKLDSLTEKKITSKNAISVYNSYLKYYKEYQNCVSPTIKGIHYYYYTDSKSGSFLHIRKYNNSDFCEKVRAAIKKKVYSLKSFGVSLEGVKIKSATTKKVTLTFKNKVTKYDVLAAETNCITADSQKITSKSKLNYTVILTGKDTYNSIYYVNSKIKVGSKKGTINIASTTPKKGKAYYTICDNKGNASFKSIKVK